MTRGMQQNDDNTYSVGNLPEYEIKVNFKDYIIKSQADRTDEVSKGLGTSWDILTGVKYVHKEKT